MDPDANLAEQRELSRQIQEGYGDTLTDTQVADLAYRLANLVAALDEWITNGGFMPRAWNAFHPPI